MKLIDIWKRKNSGEKPPKKILLMGTTLTYDEDLETYIDETKRKTIDDIFNVWVVLNDEVEIIEDAPKCDLPPYTDWQQQQIDFENKILLQKLESDTKLDIIKKYITSEEVIDNFKSIESRDEWLKVHDKILDIIDNFKLQNESGEIIENTLEKEYKIDGISLLEGISYNPKDLIEDKKIEKPILDTDNDVNGSYDIVIINDIKYEIKKTERYILGKICEIIDRLNGE